MTHNSNNPNALNLTPDPQLLEAAQVAFKQAYAPYSKFHVGAALRSESGQIYFGANVENASYGLTRCAEQSAVQTLASRGERHFEDIVVYSEAEPPASPCGACRQILFEFAPDARVVCVNHKGDIISGYVRDFLPHGFRLEDVEEDAQH
ncbi:cytidine deaminase [Deinococcus proteolyticus MRP]|uniref:Cytidine deaminase n=1 Tax=Deinococcus proteolyticus (strain ATCC 35074 / DSM 20540 / JCM 6276 / NBRC 101906 / NCIMB 13154 / VKM Ac-1939 / CCM 2703 / MRP) TaxID=693977 RepID=F0RJ24_DEIPM|nr:MULTISPECIES: cytidine deaminase [Deinococcus]ADY25432.1 cytidine deaminase [Deinococcus proteolyticus MRP]MCY1701555.1 cytidine deaminase [Deinococcus sp. SL84]